VDPSGRFVYVSNRGHDSIAIFAVDQQTGRLTNVGHEPTGGQTPRNFAIDPSGTFLYAANQNSDTIVHFRIDGQTGRLTPTGDVTEIGGPVCILFS
jgi:6-phosphogluconolactonase